MNLPRGVLVGAVCWMVAAPLFVVANVVVGWGWAEPGFSWSSHNVSDLGNVGCGVWDVSRPRWVCSPWHDVMNVAFLATAALLVAGLVLTRPVRAVGPVAWWLMALGATGLAMAGWWPADVDENKHVYGAFLVFVCGNAGLVAAGFGLRGRARAITWALGVTGVVATVLFAGQVGPVVGVGGMERVALFPLMAWACGAGVHLWKTGSRATVRMGG
jgi:hypothetical membrane protein